MKTITATSHFKAVKDKSSPNYGVKRESLEWAFDGLDTDDIVNAVNNGDNSWLEKVAVITNSKLEDYGRNLILKNAENWDFAPTSNEVNVDSVYIDITSTTSRKRKVTKESLEKCASFYARYAVQLLGKDSNQASAGAKVIESKLQLIASNTQALEVIKSNIESLLGEIDSFISNSENDKDAIYALESDFNTNAEVLEWLINECDNLISVSNEDLSTAL